MIKQLLKGIATYVPGMYTTFSRKRTGGTDSARYCYSIWLRHLVMAHYSGLPVNPKVIAEIGPGDSLGIGLAALISGAERYYAFDIVEYANLHKNLEIYEELIELFKKKERIPGEDEYPEVTPVLSSYNFPSDILTDERLNTALAQERLELIKQSVINVNKSDSAIQYKVSWYDVNIPPQDSVEMIYSQAVLQSIDDLATAYEKMFQWLGHEGFMSHSIDFRCVGTANYWNGHWTYSDLTWRLIRGKRPYSINRLPHSQHIAMMNKVGFRVVCDQKEKSPSTITHSQLAPRFKNMEQDDLTTSKTFIQAVVRN